MLHAASTLLDGRVSGDPKAGSGEQILRDDFVKSADWPKDKMWGTLAFDDSFALADISLSN